MQSKGRISSGCILRHPTRALLTGKICRPKNTLVVTLNAEVINKLKGKIAYQREFSAGPAGPELRSKADCARPSAAYEERNKESRKVKLFFSVLQ